MQEIIKEIKDFNKKVINAQAKLSISKGNLDLTAIVSEINNDLSAIKSHLKSKINGLLQNNEISIFERQALMSLMLGEDCSMFETSAVKANELIIDDIIDNSMQFFVNLDLNNTTLQDVTISKIKDIRTRMRNIAIANRQREEELKDLGTIEENDRRISHISDGKYSFDGTNYNLNLEIDSEPLEITYEPHSTSVKSIDLENNFGKIRSQGEQGSCSAFAIASVIEAFLHNGEQYSPAFLYYNARALNNATNSDSGSSIYHIIKGAMSVGVCPERMMPYNEDHFNTAPDQEAMEEAEKCKVLEARQIDIKNDLIKSLKSALSDGYPVIIAARIFDSFSDTIKGFVRHPSTDELAGKGRTEAHSNHAMVVCGFSDEQRVFKVRNSWGEGFGDRGYCYIPYSYAEKYFLQACIITKVSVSAQDNAIKIPQTLNFDANDAKIKQAILLTLIEEDKEELEKLSRASNTLKSLWSKNEGALGNVNTQTSLVNEACDRINQEIKDVKDLKKDKENEFTHKLNEYKKFLIKNFLVLLTLTLLCWIIVYIIPNTYITWVISGLFTLSTIIFAGTARYKWLTYRQELRDEIDALAQKITNLENKKHLTQINSHVHGSILREFGALRNKYHSGNQKLKTFNIEMIRCYEEFRKKLEKMSPSMSYPFLSVIDNASIDRYFENRRDKLCQVINLDLLLLNYNSDIKLFDKICQDPQIANALSHDIRRFSMSLMITNTDDNKWQFLPTQNLISETFIDLDNRAKPFSTYQVEHDRLGKYILFTGANNEVIEPLKRHFAQPPMPLDNADKDSICILNICRYNIDASQA